MHEVHISIRNALKYHITILKSALILITVKIIISLCPDFKFAVIRYYLYQYRCTMKCYPNGRVKKKLISRLNVYMDMQLLLEAYHVDNMLTAPVGIKLCHAR